MNFPVKNLQEWLDSLEQKNSSYDIDGEHYVIVEANDEMIYDERDIQCVVLYMLAVRAGDTPDEDNCLPLYHVEWEYDEEEFKQLMERYGADWGSLDWSSPDRVQPADLTIDLDTGLRL